MFARSVSDGTAIMKVMESADAGPADVWRRQRLTLPGLPQQGFRFGVPSEQFTEWDGPGERETHVLQQVQMMLLLFAQPNCTPLQCGSANTTRVGVVGS